MIYQLFWINLILVYLMLIGLVFSILYPNKRVWPPPNNKSWQYYITWIIFDFSVVITFVLAADTWGTWIIPVDFGVFIGIPIIIIGVIVVSWGIKSLGIDNTLGKENELKTEGAYKITRNPQYLGDILLYIGFILLINSMYVTILLILKILIFLLAPISEESWLLEKYGNDYLKYKSGVQRFL